jgi:hypothetical protein
MACGFKWIQFVSLMTVSVKGDVVRHLTTQNHCPRCCDEPGPKGTKVSRMEEVDSESVLVVFDEYEVKGFPDFRDRTAIYRRR